MGSPLHTGDKGALNTGMEGIELCPKKARTVPSTSKVMASVFWDVRGISFIDYFQKENNKRKKIILFLFDEAFK